MNEKEFCFIICVDDNLIFNECLHYIQHLYVPDGYTIDLLTVKDAGSMAAAYNEAMEQSNAKYKIYMHQDVMLLNPYFLADLLQIFQSDSQIGMVGLIGNETVSETGILHKENENEMFYTPSNAPLFDHAHPYRYDMAKDGYFDVAQVDGILMATSVDLRWEEEDLIGWSFLDAYQSLRVWEAGYRVVVPVQRMPWCLHDGGMANSAEIERYKGKYVQRFQDRIGKHVGELALSLTGKKRKNRIACCFMTHNHPKVIEEVLSNAVESYARHGIDLLFCDDSDTTETRELVNACIKNGASNVFYVDASGSQTASGKYVRIVKGELLPREYEYVWICKDRIWMCEDTLEKLEISMGRGFDVLMMLRPLDRLTRDCPKIKEVYTDPVAFFAHYGELTTNWEGMVYRTGTTLSEIDFDALEKDYWVAKENDLIQPAFLFSRLAQMKDMQIRVIHLPAGQPVYSKQATSGWRSRIIEIWIEQWIHVIYGLPPIYDEHKAMIIKAETNLPVLFGGIDSLILQIQEGLLTKEVFDKYRGIWTNLSDQPVEVVDLLLKGQIPEVLAGIGIGFIESVEREDVKTALNYFVNNWWMKELCDEEEYKNLEMLFACYQDKRANGLLTEQYEKEIAEKVKTVCKQLKENVELLFCLQNK